MKHELYKTKEEIENWLNKYKIKRYEIIKDKEYGYVVNVNGNVFLYKKNLKEINVKFNIIDGDFSCSEDNLISLYGCPKEVKGYLDCSNNEIISLKGCPESIYGGFYCNSNKLDSLEYFPKNIYKNCYLESNNELGEIQNINSFEELKKIHELTILNKKLKEEIIVDNEIKSATIKL